jgi:hypothetical protein
MSLPSAVELLSQHPELAAALAILLRLARAYQSDLSWPEYRAAMRVKRALFPLLDLTPIGTAILLVSDKGGRDDAEYVETVDASIREVVRDLRAAGASLHLLSSLKRRPDTHGDPLSVAHVVWTIGGEQVECYTFRNDDGTVDVYAHTEASVDNPLAHLSGTQTDGDAHGVMPELAAAE